MRLRSLGRIGLQVSELSFGTGALGMADPAEARAAIALALDRGINAFEIDAADAAAVTVLGEALAGKGTRVHIFARAASLVPFDLPSPHIRADQAYPGARLRTDVEGLLGRLGVERLALVQIHAWCPEWQHEGDWGETIEALRSEGKIAGVGVSLFDHDVDAGLEAVASGTIDAVQGMVNIFDPSAGAALLPLCHRHAVGVIARSPLYYGALAGRLDFAPEDWRHAYFYHQHRAETEARVAAIAELGAPAELAIRFGLMHPAVSTVAVGMRTPAQVEANLAAAAKGPLDADTLAALARHRWLC